MKKTTICFLALTIIMSLSFAAFANTPGINRRERNQQRRIAHGFADGQLTAREAVRLEREEAHIYRDERRAKVDGKVTFWERQHLDNELDRANRRIYRNTHDNQHRN